MIGDWGFGPTEQAPGALQELEVKVEEVGFENWGATPAEERVAVDVEGAGDGGGAVACDEVADGGELDWSESLRQAQNRDVVLTGGFDLLDWVGVVRGGQFWCAMVRCGARGGSGWCALVRGGGVILTGGFVLRN